MSRCYQVPSSCQQLSHRCHVAYVAGIAVARAPVYTAARDGTPHMFQLHAQVDAVSPNAGEQLMGANGSNTSSGAYVAHLCQSSNRHCHALCLQKHISSGMVVIG